MSMEIGALTSGADLMLSGRPRLARGSFRRIARTACLVTAVCGALVGAAPAHAGLQHEYLVFSDCPVSAMEREALCIISTVSSGEFVIGSKAVPINKTITLQGGLEKEVPEGAGSPLVPAADGDTLSNTPLQLPGGLAGTELFPPLTEVTATARLAGTASVSVLNTLSGSGTAVSLPLTVKLDNPLLGSSCVIGSTTEPIQLNLITGTTSPPLPNGPISGNPGQLKFSGDNKRGIIQLADNSLVDNAFAAPGVNGCGALPPLFDPLVDVDAGLPAPAGHNTAIMNDEVLMVEARLAAAELALPEFGRCVQAPFDVVNGKRHYHGAYTDAECLGESTSQSGVLSGKFEWLSGPGAKPKFTVTGGATTLETAAKKKLTCAGGTGAGEYTGTKTSTITMRLTECKLTATKEACQSTGGAAGEVVTGALEGRLGFIEDQYIENIATNVVGMDFTGQPALLSAECGAQKTPLSVTGSVIGRLTPIDKMSTTFVLQFSQTGGAQIPESFEDDAAKHTLSLSLGSSSPEAAGLSVKAKLTGEEKLENKGGV
jgi:hypothetical protein